MNTDESQNGLYNIHRPVSFKQVVGNDMAVEQLRGFLAKEQRPHCYVFVGPYGCGKTTLASIYAKELGCTPDNFTELNSASYRGIDSVRDVILQMQKVPIGGSKCRCFLFEEVHQMSKDAFEALLKPTEATPKHVYLFFTTTNPEKIPPALLSRFTDITVSPLQEEDLIAIMRRVVRREKEEVEDTVYESIAEMSAGSGRVCLKLLEKVLALPVKRRKDFQQVIINTGVTAIDLVRLMLKPNVKWASVAEYVKDMKDDPEGVRRMILSYGEKMLLGGNATGYDLLCFFDVPYFISRPMFVARCYEFVCRGKK